MPGPQLACSRQADIIPTIQRWRPMGKQKDAYILVYVYIEQTKPSAVIGASWTQSKVFSWLVEQKFRALSSLASFITTKGLPRDPKWPPSQTQTQTQTQFKLPLLLAETIVLKLPNFPLTLCKRWQQRRVASRLLLKKYI